MYYAQKVLQLPSLIKLPKAVLYRLVLYDGHKINVKKGAFSDNNKSFHIQS